MDDARDQQQGQDQEQGQDQQQGQLSEVGRLDPAEADTPIADDQSTAGYPDSESGTPDSGPAGPNARITDPRRDERRRLGETEENR